ncbi:MAG TPA: YiiX/YebB-like N1pC/P60 family cysteine hydrolase [Flavitalea sp.]|nr:YiiX/YebB-like N1pC/P60 family cysteine hydrolase [Flavitalea sp.]
MSAIFEWSCTGSVTIPTDDTELSLRDRIAFNDSLITISKSIIENGDLILRTGTDFSSEEVKTISPSDKTYSHAGIAVKDGHGLFIYHIEPDYYHIHDKVRKESIDTFANPANNYGFAIARYDLDDIQRHAFINYVEQQYKKRIAFDMSFDLKSNDSMYCSEMIRKGLAQATSNRVIIPTLFFKDRSKLKIFKQYLHLPEQQIMNKEIIPIDHLFLNPYCTVLKRYVFYR